MSTTSTLLTIPEQDQRLSMAVKHELLLILQKDEPTLLKKKNLEHYMWTNL